MLFISELSGLFTKLLRVLCFYAQFNLLEQLKTEHKEKHTYITFKFLNILYLFWVLGEFIIYVAASLNGIISTLN